jgi:hypothetical protein
MPTDYNVVHRDRRGHIHSRQIRLWDDQTLDNDDLDWICRLVEGDFTPKRPCLISYGADSTSGACVGIRFQEADAKHLEAITLAARKENQDEETRLKLSAAQLEAWKHRRQQERERLRQEQEQHKRWRIAEEKLAKQKETYEELFTRAERLTAKSPEALWEAFNRDVAQAIHDGLLTYPSHIKLSRFIEEKTGWIWLQERRSL